jgi:hypothetical protein
VTVHARVPMEIGSNKVAREVKPPRYPSDRREAWRPARDIPKRRGKAEALRQLLERNGAARAGPANGPDRLPNQRRRHRRDPRSARRYLVNLRRTQAPPPELNEMPQFSAGRQEWTAGRFVLRSERDIRNLFSIDTAAGAGWASGASVVCQNASFGYLGRLRVVCVQRGSVWALTLSDVPVDRPPRRNTDGANFGSFPDWRHGVGRPILPREQGVP